MIEPGESGMAFRVINISFFFFSKVRIIGMTSQAGNSIGHTRKSGINQIKSKKETVS